MTELTKALSRNENLLVLSHEHHHGLVFCARLRKADNAERETILSFVLDFWNRSLLCHFEAEERILFPLISQEDIAKRFLKEHNDIRKIISLVAEPETDFHKLAGELSRVLAEHIRFEERIMFPWLEKALGPETLKTVALKLKPAEIKNHKFSPEFWKQ